MALVFEERTSESPLVERIWRTHSEGESSFISVGVSQWQMVVWQQAGRLNLTVRGPETKAQVMPVPPDAEFFGVFFKLGTLMPRLPASTLVDAAVTLPDAASQSFWLDGSAWQFPNYENADTFIERLAREGLLVRDPLIDSALHDQPQRLTPRTLQRRFLQATGLTQGAVRQIERARQATLLLKQGASILDAVDEAGYSDQPHLTRALKHFTGQTPAQLRQTPESMSFLFKTDTLD